MQQLGAVSSSSRRVDVLELPFELWRERLHEDCVHEAMLAVFHILGAVWLTMLWELGIPPSVQGITQTKRKL